MGAIGYFWYVEPSDSHTNEVFSRELPHRDCSREVVDAKGKRHNLWECPPETVAQFVNSREDQHLMFRIFNRPVYKKGLGKLRNCGFLFFRKRKQKKPAKALSS